MAWKIYDDRVPFNKEQTLEEIQDQLPQPWMWCTLAERIVENNPPPECPHYDILVTRTKKVTEIIKHHRSVQGPATTEVTSTYSIILGVIISDEISPYADDDALTTAVVTVRSSRELFDILNKLDRKEGGIK
jgi:hypothetical protein